MTFSDWLNKTQMTSFGAFCNQIVVLFIVVFFSLLSRTLILMASAVHQGYGMQLSTTIIALVGGKLIVNAASAHSVRATSKEYVEAKVRGEATAAAAEERKTQEHDVAKIRATAAAKVQEPPTAPTQQVNVKVGDVPEEQP